MTIITKLRKMISYWHTSVSHLQLKRAIYRHAIFFIILPLYTHIQTHHKFIIHKYKKKLHHQTQEMSTTDNRIVHN